MADAYLQYGVMKCKIQVLGVLVYDKLLLWKIWHWDQSGVWLIVTCNIDATLVSYCVFSALTHLYTRHRCMMREISSDMIFMYEFQCCIGDMNIFPNYWALFIQSVIMGTGVISWGSKTELLSYHKHIQSSQKQASMLNLYISIFLFFTETGQLHVTLYSLNILKFKTDQEHAHMMWLYEPTLFPQMTILLCQYHDQYLLAIWRVLKEVLK